MSKNKKNELIKKAIEIALCKYSEENFDIMKNEENNMIDIVYHSRHNSFPIISNICSAEDLTEEDIEKLANSYNIGYAGF